MEQKIKFCKDCKHSHPGFVFGWEFARCSGRQDNEGYLTHENGDSFCGINRLYDHACGASAKYFEPCISKPGLMFRHNPRLSWLVPFALIILALRLLT